MKRGRVEAQVVLCNNNYLIYYDRPASDFLSLACTIAICLADCDCWIGGFNKFAWTAIKRDEDGMPRLFNLCVKVINFNCGCTSRSENRRQYCCSSLGILNCMDVWPGQGSNVDVEYTLLSWINGVLCWKWNCMHTPEHNWHGNKTIHRVDWIGSQRDAGLISDYRHGASTFILLATIVTDYSRSRSNVV